MNVCEQCGKEHDGTFGSGRFCCRSCSNKYVALHQSPEAKARKVAKGAKNLVPHPESFKKRRHVFTPEDRERASRSRRVPIEDIFSGKVSYGTNHLKLRLIHEGYKEWKCERCGITEWNGLPISLHLHHKNGKSKGNALDNLEILCPNCHSQTDNYGFKGCSKKS